MQPVSPMLASNKTVGTRSKFFITVITPEFRSPMPRAYVSPDNRPTDAKESTGNMPQAGKAAIFRESGRRFQRQYVWSCFDQQAFDTLEASWQLVATPATFALVVLQILGLERQRALARLQHQRRAGRQYGEID